MKKIIPGLLIAAAITAGGAYGAQMYANKEVAKEVAESIAKVSEVMTVTYGKARADIFKKTAYIEDVTITPLEEGAEPSHIDTIEVIDVDMEHDFPTFMRMNFKGMDFDIDTLGERAEVMRSMGYEKLKSDVEIDYRYDVEAKELFVNNITNRTPTFGTVGVKLHLSNIDLTAGFMSLLMTFPTINIHSAELSYVDDSFLPRLMKVLASNTGASDDEMKQQLLATFDAEIEAATDDVAREAFTATRNFFEDPKRITLSVSPEKPVQLMELQQVTKEEIPKLLNVRVTN